MRKKMQGADIRQGIELNELLIEENNAVGVSTNQGNIFADAVVIAAGAWSPIFAAQAGVGLPMAPVRSQYWITERNDIFPVHSPIVLLPDAQALCETRRLALCFLVSAKKSMSVSPKEIPADIRDFPFSPDKGISDLSEVIDNLARFFPAVYDALG